MLCPFNCIIQDLGGDHMYLTVSSCLQSAVHSIVLRIVRLFAKAVRGCLGCYHVTVQFAALHKLIVLA